MKKILFTLAFVSLLVGGCTDKLQNDKDMLQKEVTELTQQKQGLQLQVDSIKSILISEQEAYDTTETSHRNSILRTERMELEKDILQMSPKRDKLQLELIRLQKHKQYINTIHILKIKIHQTTYTLSITEHIKNKINDIEFEIPVDKDLYDNIQINQELTNSEFKMGSLLRDLDLSKLKITVIGKRKINRNK